ncbi:MAG: 1-deoxy-D-xylulose-5-phosphate synthase [Acidimicrobiales bacterium]
MLPSIETPADLRSLNYEQLAELAIEIRAFIVETVNQTGGHLGSNLGAVELTLALHRVFDSPRDPILWDTGHQAYVHKLLTGRRHQFVDLRREGGLSGYPNRSESDHDWIENSHASTALSYAHGLATALELDGELVGAGGNRRVVAVVGDGALTGGMAYEALNNLGHSECRVVIVLNDNGRSYAPTVSHLSQSLTSLRLHPAYVQTRQRVGRRIRNIPALGEMAATGFLGLTSAVREIVAPHVFFEALGVRYAGPIDGHDIAQMEQAFANAAGWDGPIVVHVLTQKGRGYAPAEEDEIQRLHDVKASRVAAPDTVEGTPPPAPVEPVDDLGVPATTYTDAFTRALIAEAERDADIVALTAAMPGPTGLLAFQQRFPDRCFDVGIAEQHEVTAAAGLAMGGRKPVVAVYSTFFSRAFDQANLDVGLHHLPVVFVLDRAGLTGENGPSHHGIWDLALALSVPEMTVFAPSNGDEVGAMLSAALGLDGPSTIRFPTTAPPRRRSGDPVGQGLSARRTQAGDGSVCLLGVGKMLAACEKAATELAGEGLDATVWDVRVVSPPDPEMLADAAGHRLVVTVEDGVRFGGAGMFLTDALASWARGEERAVPPVTNLGIPRSYIPQGRADDLLAQLGLDGPGVAATVRQLIDRHGSDDQASPRRADNLVASEPTEVSDRPSASHGAGA